MEPDIEGLVNIIPAVQKYTFFECCCQCQIVSGFKTKNVKKLRDLLTPAQKNNCKCHSVQTVDWK